MQLRPMTEADLESVLKVQSSTQFQHWTLEQFQRELELDYSLDFVLISGTIVTGFAIWHQLDVEAELCSIAIDASMQKTGLGSFMLKGMHQYLQTLSIRRYFLEVRVSNSAAQALYSKFGYTCIGLRRKYYADGEDAVLMACGELN